MPRIDAHQHFWQYTPEDYGWIDNEMSLLRRDFLPQDLQAHLNEHQLDGCIAVQARQSPEENEFLLKLAAQYTFIKGVVGWVDLQSAVVHAALEEYSTQPTLKGFRHVLQGEANRKLMLEKPFMNGIASLAKYGFTYDILIFPDQLPHTVDFVRHFPDQLFVIDHLAKPYIKAGQMEPWKQYMQQLAGFENVYCKLSGMVTEAAWQGWTYAQLAPYLQVVTEAFGTNRLMYGSDWPVCLVAALYNEVIGVVKQFFEQGSITEQQAIFGGNAARFYQL
ncbi:MAG TPA: amidohydrolase family protein [Phnomibacter sp.]|nr:amidohydrolase family protein [Phnomibacter sp.]